LTCWGRGAWLGRRLAGAAGVRRPERPASLERVRKALRAYGCDPADLKPLPGQDRRPARYLVSSHSRLDLFVKVVSRERRDSDLLYRASRWLKYRGRPPGQFGDAVAQVEHEASMGLLAAAAGIQVPPVLLVRSFGNGVGLLVQHRVAGRDLTGVGAERLDDATLADVWHQVARLRAARIAHGDLGLASVLLDKQGKVWLVDFDRAEAAASQPLLDRDLATLLAALGRVADPARVHATAKQPSARTSPKPSRRSQEAIRPIPHNESTHWGFPCTTT
jgi:glycosyltransferase 2 family protein